MPDRPRHHHRQRETRSLKGPGKNSGIRPQNIPEPTPQPEPVPRPSKPLGEAPNPPRRRVAVLPESPEQRRRIAMLAYRQRLRMTAYAARCAILRLEPSLAAIMDSDTDRTRIVSKVAVMQGAAEVVEFMCGQMPGYDVLEEPKFVTVMMDLIDEQMRIGTLDRHRNARSELLIGVRTRLGQLLDYHREHAA